MEDHDCTNDQLPSKLELLRDLLLLMDACKSMGSYGIYPRVLRELAVIITKLLSILFQQSWESGEIPVD